MFTDLCFDSVNLLINNDDALKYVSWSVWIIGVLGNLVNVVVFGHKNMNVPANRILWWLSIFDLFQLTSMAAYTIGCGWCTYIDMFSPHFGSHSYFGAMILFSNFYLLQIFHNITVGLNIMLAIWRYLAVAYPLRREIQCSFRSVTLTVAALSLLSFLLCLPVLFAYHVKEDHYIVDGTGVPMYSEIPDYSIQKTFDDDNYYYYIYCVALRITLFIALIDGSMMLILAVIRTTRSRERIVASETNTQQKQANMITKVIMVILLMFLLTEVPMALSGALWIRINMDVEDFDSDAGDFDSCEDVLSHLLQLCFLVNCSYNIFCYLALSTQYKETLRSILTDRYDRVRSLEREFAPGTQQETESEQM